MPEGAERTAGAGGTGTAADAAGLQSAATPAALPEIRRMNRRATTEPVAGSDPRPAPEAPRHTLTENDARLKAEKPPHY